jgi:hypothetical protein
VIPATMIAPPPLIVPPSDGVGDEVGAFALGAAVAGAPADTASATIESASAVAASTCEFA